MTVNDEVMRYTGPHAPLPSEGNQRRWTVELVDGDGVTWTVPQGSIVMVRKLD